MPTELRRTEELWPQLIEYCVRHIGADVRLQGNTVGTANVLWPDIATVKETLAAAHEAFSRYSALTLEQLAEELPANSQELVHSLQATLEHTADKHLGPGAEGSKPTSELICQAHLSALKALHQASDAHLKSSSKSQLIHHKDGWLVLKRAPALENLVLRGGGARGLAYVPILKLLDESHIMKSIRRIAGTSAGALTAACWACGATPAIYEEFVDKISVDTSMISQLWGSPGEGGHSARTDSWIGFGAAPLYQKLRDFLNQQFARAVKDNQAQLARLCSPSALERLNQLQAGSQASVTFADLSLLHRLDPEHFKELTLTGFDQRRKELCYFNASDYPDMEIAEAARISMSIPVVFSSIGLPDQDTDPQTGEVKKFVRSMVDGGIGSNMPVEVFNDRRGVSTVQSQQLTPQEQLIFAKTLLLSFHDDGEVYRTLHSAGQASLTFFEWLAGVTEEAVKADWTKVYNAGPNVLVVFHGTLGMLSFFASKERIRGAQLVAEMGGRDFLWLRRNQAIPLSFSDPMSAIAALDPEEIPAAVAALDPRTLQLLASEEAPSLTDTPAEQRQTQSQIRQLARKTLASLHIPYRPPPPAPA